MEAIIELTDIKKAYGQTEVLNHFNLSIDQGEFITIIGTSGSGKTTVLKMINGLIQPTSGHVKVHGQDIQEQDLIQLRRHMGYVIQGSVLFLTIDLRFDPYFLFSFLIVKHKQYFV